MENITNDFLYKIPKAELHIHIEGTLEPELMFKIGKRNNIELKYSSVDDLKNAYNFYNLQSFLDIYYEATKVLIHEVEVDFYDMTYEYLLKAKQQGVVHTEIFFDPQTHTNRHIEFKTIISWIKRALNEGKEKLGISSKLIMCFLRHLSEQDAIDIYYQSKDFTNLIDGICLDSSEVNNPPSKFKNVYEKAKNDGLHLVAHAGEEGPPQYIWEALQILDVKRIDHGIRCVEDYQLLKYLVENKIPLTVCPLSNIKLAVYKNMENHKLKEMLDAGLIVTVNSDDPAYFGGYIGDNFIAINDALDLSKQHIYQLCLNSLKATFLKSEEKQKLIELLDNFIKEN